MKQAAVVLTDNSYASLGGKVAHGLVRGTERFDVVAVVDRTLAGQDAGVVLDGRFRGIPIVGDVEASLRLARAPRVAVVGCAPHGGRLTAQLRDQLIRCARLGLSLVSGLHDYLSDDEEIVELVAQSEQTITDVRKPPKPADMHFWSGAVHDIRAHRIAVLGTDCAIGKRTTTRWLTESLRRLGHTAEMIYTGQTGWMQGGRFGIVHDSLPGDFVSGELEYAMVQCHRELDPDFMLIEGQSSLRNPAGPCGSTLLLSASADAAIVQHAPARTNYDGQPGPRGVIPSLQSEIALIEAHGVPVAAVTLNLAGLSVVAADAVVERYRRELGVPVICPLAEGTDRLGHLVGKIVAPSRAA